MLKKNEKKIFFFHFILLNWRNDSEGLNLLCSKMLSEYTEFSYLSCDVFRFGVRCMVMKVLISKWYQKIYMTHHNELKYCHILNILRRTVIIRRLLDSLLWKEYCPACLFLRSFLSVSQSEDSESVDKSASISALPRPLLSFVSELKAASGYR